MSKLVCILILTTFTKLLSQQDSTGKNLVLPRKICSDFSKKKLYYNCTDLYRTYQFIEIFKTTPDLNLKNVYQKYLKAEKAQYKFIKCSQVSLIAMGVFLASGIAVSFADDFEGPSVGLVIAGLGFGGVTVFSGLSATFKNLKKKRILYKEMPEVYNTYANQ